MSSETASAIEAVWRLESARIVGALARLVRDVGLAEEIASVAFLAALEQWPTMGIPPNPGAWLMVAAKHRAIDRLRRNDTLKDKVATLGRDLERDQVIAAFGDGLDASISATEDEINDDVLRLIFVSCHPALPVESRVALTLRVVAGLRTPEIARAYLVGEAALAQRIVRAKRTLRKHGVPFELPPSDQWTDRLTSVLEAIYLIFNEGYAASEGDELVKPKLCYEAVRLGRALAEIMPAEPEVHGLVALMEIHASRLPTRSDDAGEPIPLLEQDRARWDQLLLRRGFTALLRAGETDRPVGRYVLQAAIAACHGRARSADATDWAQIVALYDLLSRVAPSPVIELNRAVALAMSAGPSRGLEAVDKLAEEPSLQDYNLLPSVRADLLIRLGRLTEARDEFERAASMTRNERQRESLLRRAEACRST